MRLGVFAPISSSSVFTSCLWIEAFDRILQSPRFVTRLLLRFREIRFDSISRIRFKFLTTLASLNIGPLRSNRVTFFRSSLYTRATNEFNYRVNVERASLSRRSGSVRDVNSRSTFRSILVPWENFKRGKENLFIRSCSRREIALSLRILPSLRAPPSSEKTWRAKTTKRIREEEVAQNKSDNFDKIFKRSRVLIHIIRHDIYIYIYR